MSIFVSFNWWGKTSYGWGNCAMDESAIQSIDDVRAIEQIIKDSDERYNMVALSGWQHFDTPASDVANDGYTDHDGDLAKAPMGYKIVDVVFATGGVASGLAEYFVWEHMADGADIVRWRYAE